MSDSFNYYIQKNVNDYPAVKYKLLNMDKFNKLFYLPFENTYDGMKLLLFSRNHFYLGFIVAALYIILIVGLKKYMENRKAIKNIDTILPYWNLGMSIFSFIGTTRLLPYLFTFIYNNGLDCLICSPPVYSYGRGPPGLWTGLFIYSKYIELIDTIIIVLKKSHLSFIHCYHHASVLAYTWHAYIDENPSGLVYASMNYFVHTFMYFYYYLASSGEYKKPQWGMLVTLLQIVQMIIGTLITMHNIYLATTRTFMYESTFLTAINPKIFDVCYYSLPNIIFAAGIYTSYLYLFANFFVQKYIRQKIKKHR